MKNREPNPFATTIEMNLGAEGENMVWEKVEWTIDGQRRGLRYGDNPDQPAALYRLRPAHTAPYLPLVSECELIQSGKHPGKNNIGDIDSALHILRYLDDSPCAIITKHHNPCGAALAPTIAEAYDRAFMADSVAAFGGVATFNRPVDRETADLILRQFMEVVAAPDFESSALALFQRRRQLRVVRIPNIANLSAYAEAERVDLRCLLDGGLMVQRSFVSRIRTPSDFRLASVRQEGQTITIRRAPTEREKRDLLFGWFVICGVTSNSIVYVQDGVTVGIGTGEQDRVGAAGIARDKAYRKLAERLSRDRYGVGYDRLEVDKQRSEIDAEVRSRRGGLKGSVMISDGFFPFRDGVDVGIEEGVTAIAQPGGSIRDREVIEACNEREVAMVFTDQRAFRH